MRFLDLSQTVYEGWLAFGSRHKIVKIHDISAQVSTNHVFRVDLSNQTHVIAKASYFGDCASFTEDHEIIKVLAHNLLYPYENLISKSIIKGDKVFIHQTKVMNMDVWVVFYNPIRTDRFFPKILNLPQVKTFGEEMGKFHLACSDILEQLPQSSHSMRSDMILFLESLNDKDDISRFHLRNHLDVIRHHGHLFLENSDKLGLSQMENIPVFIDWNIGNFSINAKHRLFSRWDYDWFRLAPRTMDFYFLSRVVSTQGDKTVFSYLVDPLMGDRFIAFLKEYHAQFPLQKNDILFLKEAYRFFILMYVIHYGHYFFHEFYATTLLKEAFDIYLPALDEQFDATKLLKALDL